MDLPGLRRLRYILAMDSLAVAAVLLSLGIALVIGGLLYPPHTASVSDVEHEEEIGITQETYAVVENDTVAYDRGDRVTGHVFTRAAAQNISLDETVAVPEGTDATISVLVQHQAVEAENRSDTVLTKSRVLDRHDGVVDDGEWNATVEFDVSEITQQNADLQEEFGSSVTVQTSIITRVEYDTGEFTGTTKLETPVTFNRKTLHVSDDRVVDTRQNITEKTQLVEGKNRLIGGLAFPHETLLFWGIALILIMCGVFAVESGRRINPHKAELELKTYRFREWVSRVEGPLDDRWEEALKVQTLDELVDLAIDCNTRVLYDTAKAEFGVLQGDRYFYYPVGPSHMAEYPDVRVEDAVKSAVQESQSDDDGGVDTEAAEGESGGESDEPPTSE